MSRIQSADEWTAIQTLLKVVPEPIYIYDKPGLPTDPAIGGLATQQMRSSPAATRAELCSQVASGEFPPVGIAFKLPDDAGLPCLEQIKDQSSTFVDFPAYHFWIR